MAKIATPIRVVGKPFEKGHHVGRPKGSRSLQTRLLSDAVLLAAKLEGDVELMEFHGPRSGNARDKEARKQRWEEVERLYEETEQEAAKRGGLVGYCRYLARCHPSVFATLLKAVLPLQIKLSADEQETTYRTVAQIQADLSNARLPMRRLAPLLLDMAKGANGTYVEDD